MGGGGSPNKFLSLGSLNLTEIVQIFPLEAALLPNITRYPDLWLSKSTLAPRPPPPAPREDFHDPSLKTEQIFLQKNVTKAFFLVTDR